MKRSGILRQMQRAETLAETLVEAWNAQSASTIAGLFAANGRIYARSRVVLGIGNTAVRDVFEALGGAACRGVLRLSGVKALRVGDRSRLLRAEWVMSGEPQGVPVFRGRFTVLIEWKEGRWQIGAMDLEDLADIGFGTAHSARLIAAQA